MGTCLLPEEGDHPQPREYEFDVSDPGAPEETWWQGVTLFLNPNATVPLPADFLPATCVIAREDGVLTMEIDGFHPMTSLMRAVVPGQKDAGENGRNSPPDTAAPARP